jgi:hypothetical protein
MSRIRALFDAEGLFYLLVTGPSFCTKRCESLHHSFGL